MAGVLGTVLLAVVILVVVVVVLSHPAQWGSDIHQWIINLSTFINSLAKGH